MRAVLILLVLGAGCVRAPDVVIVDRKTALEQQASGSFRGLEEELEQAGLLPRPTPLTGAQLEEAGVQRAARAIEAGEGLPDSLRADTLLTQRCVGESLEGTLVLTVASCTGTIDVPQTNRLIERLNRNRRQLWQWMAERSRGASPAQAQATWRKWHLEGVVCGGQVQRDDGTWEIKRC
jgi:uncharacterized protein YdbL (DUF1318 family)